jgi:uncharacterized protein (UPF0332 family)
MNLERLLKENLVKKQKPDFKQITQQVLRAEKDVQTAQATIKTDKTWAITIAYHSMIRAGRALMYSKGYLPTAKFTHKTIVEFTKDALGQELDTLVIRFERLRKRRHEFIYESKNHVTDEEANAAIDTANKITAEVKRLIRAANPQAELF